MDRGNHLFQEVVRTKQIHLIKTAEAAAARRAASQAMRELQSYLEGDNRRTRGGRDLRNRNKRYVSLTIFYSLPSFYSF